MGFGVQPNAPQIKSTCEQVVAQFQHSYFNQKLCYIGFTSEHSVGLFASCN